MAYSEEEKEAILKEVVDRLIDGESLRKISADSHLPDRVTIIRWLNDNDEYATTIARARDWQADGLYDDISEILELVRVGELDHQIAKTMIWAKQWQAAKMNPKRYGDKVTQEHTGAGGGPIKTQAITFKGVGPDHK